MNIKRMLLAAVGLLLLTTAEAHEFWLEPIRFSGKTFVVRFRVGEHFAGDNWKGDFNKVRLLSLLNHQQANALPAATLLPAAGDSLRLQAPLDGTQTLIYNGTNTYIELAPAAFAAYLQEDGLTDVLAWRKEQGKDSTVGREYYQRSVKTLLQNGRTLHPVNYPTELPLDIVPLQNPYGLQKSGTVAFNVFFKQRPLPQAMVKVWHRSSRGVVKSYDLPMTNGRVEVPVTTDGRWMISLVKMVPHTADQTADWQSYWASITWGYD
ncbi:MAG: DUF4198 domain-containing protein [Chitinophagaceae bacterium]|nr:DUF4198 domain-containing protein [Chitinophagaceae bacterium]